MGGVFGMVELPGEPEHLGGAADSFTGVAKIGIEQGGADGLHAVVPGFGKTFGLGQPEIGAEGGLEAGEVEDVVAGGVTPIDGAFLEPAIGGEELHDAGHRRAGQADDGGGAGGFVFGNGEGAEGEAAVTDLAPVVAEFFQPAAGGHIGKPGIEAFFDNGLADGGAVGRGEEVIEPVVADAEGGGHFGGVEEVLGIPVGKGGGGEHFIAGAGGVPAVAVQAVESGEEEDAAFDFPAGEEKGVFFAADFVVQGGLFEDDFGGGLHFLIERSGQGVGFDGFPDGGQFVIEDEQARVEGAEGFENIAGSNVLGGQANGAENEGKGSQEQ